MSRIGQPWPSTLAALALASVASAATGACGKDAAEQQNLTRSGDKPAVVLVGEQQAKANSVAEVEPNSDVGEAQPLPVGSAVGGILQGSTDVDRYSFVAATTGLVFAEVSGGGEADLTLSLHDGSGGELAKSDRGPAGISEGIPGFGVEAGVSYQLVVGEFVGRKLRKAGGRVGDSAPYSLEWSIREDAEPGFEREPNADITGASEILGGEERRGYIGWNGDKDLWRMPITGFDDVVAAGAGASKPALHIVLSPVPGVATQLSLLTATGDVLAERRGAKGQEVAIRNFLPEVGAEFYALQIAGKPSNPVESYMLRVDTVEIGPGTEEEPNDTLALATPIGGDDSSLLLARGEVSMGDVDVFRIMPVSHDRILDLQMRGAGHADLDVTVVAESGAIIASAAADVVGGIEALSRVPVSAGQSPLLQVTAKTLQGPADYELSISLVRGTAPPIAPPAPPADPAPANTDSQPE